ncbi:MAG: hemolysin III family protein [Candidatus Pacebacteria bacterium]|nr:hemolysin III family protein [Candidatus Paceibacterota bacterium]
MKIKDPVSGYSHLIGGILAIIGMIALIVISVQNQQIEKITPFAIFGLSMILLYFSSGLYHLFGKKAEEVDIFRKIDHAMIYILIAGTYTPLCLIGIKGLFGIISVIVIWILAAGGISTVFFKKFWSKMPRWGATGIYILMGWISVFLIYPLYKTISLDGVLWILAGGLFYTIGAVIYAIKKPNPMKGFGFHEIFHIFVLLGTLCHFWCIFRYLAL